MLITRSRPLILHPFSTDFRSSLTICPTICPTFATGPRPFCPVLWEVLWWRTGALSIPWPCPVLSLGGPGGEGRGGPGIRVWAQWLGAVVSTLLTHTHAVTRRCRGLISRTQRLMLGRVLAVTGYHSLESGKERGRETVPLRLLWLRLPRLWYGSM